MTARRLATCAVLVLLVGGCSAGGHFGRGSGDTTGPTAVAPAPDPTAGAAAPQPGQPTAEGPKGSSAGQSAGAANDLAGVRSDLGGIDGAAQQADMDVNAAVAAQKQSDTP